MSQSNKMNHIDEVLNLVKWLIEVDEAEGEELPLEAALEMAQYMLTQPYDTKTAVVF